ncbi:hypothetical protein JOF55_002234 [Haloactinomyces albus]|uniref:Uncharacterized protein n=1 Tax=Haloactinomyces albus TaxID=1352928 RepID=A0AAE4CPU1_9ACTN|nr:hypothetical protein [Haloactinomyces albus]
MVIEIRMTGKQRKRCGPPHPRAGSDVRTEITVPPDKATLRYVRWSGYHHDVGPLLS